MQDENNYNYDSLIEMFNSSNRQDQEIASNIFAKLLTPEEAHEFLQYWEICKMKNMII